MQKRYVNFVQHTMLLGSAAQAPCSDTGTDGAGPRHDAMPEAFDFHKRLPARMRERDGVDVVMECVGSPTFDASLRSLRPGGRLVLVGNVDNSKASLPLGLVILKAGP